MADGPNPTRRERLRAEALTEIRRHAWEQICGDGVEALSLNAVARSMRMSGPAIYRYYDSRDALLAALVGDAWGSLADALEEAARIAARRRPAPRLRAICESYRAWALEQPNRYKLALETSYGSGRFAPEATLPASGRAMAVLLEAVLDLGPLPARRDGSVPALAGQLRAWAESRDLPARATGVALELSVLAFARIHGVVSLELTGTFESMGLDPELVFATEVGLILDHFERLERASAVQ